VVAGYLGSLERMAKECSCPKCGAELVWHPSSAEVSVGRNVALEVVGWGVFLLVLWALSAQEVGRLVAIAAAVMAVALLCWRFIARDRGHATHYPESYSCPKCLGVFSAGQLQLLMSSKQTHAL